MEYKSKKIMLSIIMWTMFYALQFKVCFTFSWQEFNETEAPAPSQTPSRPSFPRRPYNKTEAPTPSPSAYYFFVEGDSVQDGFTHATVYVGKDSKKFFLDVDTGSDLTWISCSPPNNVKLLKPVSPHQTPNGPYVANNNVISCEDASVCGFVKKPKNSQCSEQIQQCDYQVEYADHGTSLGILVKDAFALSSSLFGNPLESTASLAFGCGYHQEFSSSSTPPAVDGVLGLGGGEASILSQLSSQGLIKKVMALCLSDKDGLGYLVLGDSQYTSFKWKSSPNNGMELNMLGPANILYENDLIAKSLHFLLDSGTSYTYFSSSIYHAVLSQVKRSSAKLGTLVVDPYLSVCWKPVGSSTIFLLDSGYFNLTFTKDVYFEFGPFEYLVISPRDNVCLGILDSKELGTGFENLNIIGGVSLHQRMVSFDYENQEIGWDNSHCGTLPRQLLSKKATSPHTLPSEKMKGKSNREKDVDQWHMRKKRKMLHL